MSIKSLILFMGATLFVLSSGCRDKNENAGGAPRTGIARVSSATVWYMCRDRRPVLAVWVDSTAFASGSGTETGFTVVDGPTVSIRCDDERTANINERTYELAKGAIFLVRTQHRLADIKQLTKQLSGIACGDQGVTSLATSDSDIATFVKESHPSQRERRFN